LREGSRNNRLTQFMLVERNSPLSRGAKGRDGEEDIGKFSEWAKDWEAAGNLSKAARRGSKTICCQRDQKTE